MATEAVIDIDTLIQPISDEKPQGENIREDFSPSSIYYQIKDARAGARTSERQRLMNQGDDHEALLQMVPEWNTVLELAPKILTNTAKDLEVASWYCEALLRAHGFGGLRDGFKLIHALVENFWDDIYPLPDEDGVETRIAPLTGLNGEDGEGTLIAPIRQVPLTQGYSDLPFAGWQYEQAYEVESIQDPEKKEARLAGGAISMKTIEQSVVETPVTFFQTLKDDLDQTLNNFTELSAALDELCGNDAPPSSNIRNALKREIEIVGFLTKNIVLEAEDNASEVSGEETEIMTEGTSNTAGNGPSIDKTSISSRDEAFRALIKVSEFFKRTEPHSPISYNLEQAVKWGHMSLPELLKELIPDERAREEYCRLAGIKEE